MMVSTQNSRGFIMDRLWIDTFYTNRKFPNIEASIFIRVISQVLIVKPNRFFGFLSKTPMSVTCPTEQSSWFKSNYHF